MVKTLCQAASATVVSTANTTQYWGIAGTIKANSNANKALSELIFKNTGILSNLLVHLTANSVGTTGSVFTLHKNGSNVTQTIAVGASATGNFQDAVHSDAVAADDRFCLETDPLPTTGTFSISVISLTFEATTNTITRLAKNDAISFTAASTTTYAPLQGAGAMQAGVTNLTHTQMPVSGTLQRLSVYVSANRATDTHVKLFYGAGPTGGNNDVTITGGGAAGWYHDTSHTDTVTALDDFSYGVTTGLGADTLTIQAICCEFETTTGDGLCVLSAAAGVNVADNVTRYFHISGAIAANATETGATGVETITRIPCTFDELTCVIGANDVSSNSTLTLRKTGTGDTTMVVSITGSTAGVFLDSAHPQTVLATDLMTLEATVPSVSSAHNVNFRTISMQSHLATAAQTYTHIANIKNLVGKPTIFFDGSNDKVDCTNDATLWSQSLTKFSFAVWAYPTAGWDTNLREIVNHGGTSNQSFRNVIHASTANKVEFTIKDSSAVNHTAANTTLQLNQWNHVTCVYDNSLGSANLKIFVNSTVGGTTADLAEAINISSALTLAQTSTDFQGNMRDFRWYTTKALTQTEINNIYANNGSAPAPDYWLKMDENTGTTTTDSISGTKVGTFSGAVWGTQAAPTVWQGGPTFTHFYNIIAHIAQTYTHIYNILESVAAVAQTYTHKYNIKNLINQSYTHKWNIKNIIAQVFTHKWNIIGRAAQTFTHKYNIKNLIAQIFTHKYNIKNLINQSYTHKYNIKNLIAQTFTHKWNIIAHIAQQFTHKYNIKNLINQSYTHKYNIKTLISQTYTHFWNIIAHIAQTYSHKYNIWNLVNQLFTHKYNIIAHIAQVFTHKYNIANLVNQTYTHKWNIIAHVAQVFTHVYNILGVASVFQTYTFKYNIKNLANQSYTHKYNIWNLIAQTFTHKWNIINHIAQTYTHKYNIINHIAQVFTHKYNIINFATQAFTHKYNIKNLVNQSYTHKYNIKTLINQTYTHFWNIINHVAQTYTHKYNIIAHVAQTFTHIYNILSLSGVFQTYTFKYNIKNLAAQSYTHKYNIWNLINQAFTHKYNIRNLVNQTFTHKYNILNLVAQTFTHYYNILSLAAVNQVYTFKYNIRNLVNQSYTHKWNINNLVAKLYTHKWNIKTLINQTFTHKYGIKALISQIFTHKYNIWTLVGQTFTHKWNIIAHVAKTFTHKYGIKTLVNETYTHKWNITKIASQTYTHVYNISNKVSETYTHKWNIKNLVAKIFTHSYNIKGLATTKVGKITEYIVNNYEENDPSL